MVIKFVMLFPFLITIALVAGLLKPLYNLYKKARIKRQDKPDIVFSNIVSGFIHLIRDIPEIELLATQRAEICSKCPFAQKTGMYSMIIDNKTKSIQGYQCTKCGCNLSAKVRSIEDRCPLRKW
jgi:hypothetical protein